MSGNNYLFAIDEEALTLYSEELAGIVDRAEADKGKRISFDYKVDITAYIHMERNCNSEERLRSMTDSSTRKLGDLIIRVAETVKNSDEQMAKDISENDEL